MGCDIRSIGIVLALSAVVCGGCSGNSWSPEKLAQQVADADHAVASDCYHGSLLVVTGQDATNLIQAVATAKGLRKDVSAATLPRCKIEFCRQTSVLATIMVQEEWFAANGEAGEYTENSGVLKALQRRLETSQAGRKAWVDFWAHDILQKPEFGTVRNWSGEVLHRYALGELKTEGADNGTNDVKVSHQEIPAWLTAPGVYIHRGRSGRAESVRLDWFNYGLLVDPTNYTTTFQQWYITSPGPGIFAYHVEE